MKHALKTFAASFVTAFGLVAVLAAAPAEKQPAIGGYCPVAYVKAGKAMKGDPRYTSEQDGRVYQFSSEGAKKMFEAEPAKYRVAHDGWCATGVAMGKKLASNPEIYAVRDGVTYLFSNAEAKVAFDKSPDMTIAKASENWPKIK